MRKLPKGKNAKETALTVVWLLEPFKPYVKTITTDNGTEFAHHKYITGKLGITLKINGFSTQYKNFLVYLHGLKHKNHGGFFQYLYVQCG